MLCVLLPFDTNIKIKSMGHTFVLDDMFLHYDVPVLFHYCELVLNIASHCHTLTKSPNVGKSAPKNIPQ